MTQPSTDQPGETPTPATGETPEAQPTNKPTLEELQAQLASAQQRISELNKESAKHRKLAEAATQAEEARKTAEMTELQKAQKATEDALKAKADSETRLRQALIQSAILDRANVLNFADANDALALLGADKVEVKEDGTIDKSAIETELKAILKAKPYLLKKATTPSGLPTNAGGQGTQGETVEQQRNRVYNRRPASGMFDPAYAAAHGGGVLVTSKGDKE